MELTDHYNILLASIPLMMTFTVMSYMFAKNERDGGYGVIPGILAFAFAIMSVVAMARIMVISETPVQPIRAEIGPPAP